MNGKVSMQTIADALGVSKNAVSLALSGKSGVSESLRDRVFETANLLGYRARTDKEGRRTRNLLVLIPKYLRHDQGFYKEIYWAIDRRAKETGCAALRCEITEQMEEALLLPQEWHQALYEGLLLLGVFREKYVRRLLDLGAPLVIVDHDYDTLKLDAVVTANTTEAFRIVSYLIGLGHREIGFIGAIGMTRSFMERWLGYCQAMSEAGLAIPDKYCLTGEAPLATLHSQPSEVQAWLEGLDGYPTAWFCANDRIAVNLIEMLTAAGVRIPGGAVRGGLRRYRRGRPREAAAHDGPGPARAAGLRGRGLPHPQDRLRRQSDQAVHLRRVYRARILRPASGRTLRSCRFVQHRPRPSHRSE
ncbi:LacI family DNA-binding transcriptional regulator [Cohnella rhizosphaerae]|uniref:LacI family DNA-binding transcriptional regulator n=1 Tax=Cohnella rhizosphaerae TaxID=1457232 RepID=A0A9X4KZI6_9BACL|nr:LacI family DNA-binding transcriptional regulator [Cohnella rhizosphaerae]MDG0814174.1 LacI family DNA-binding transcriptional regulator [Cohnella rhizosphaerae]